MTPSDFRGRFEPEPSGIFYGKLKVGSSILGCGLGNAPIQTN
jgi:hypothetical protein